MYVVYISLYKHYILCLYNSIEHSRSIVNQIGKCCYYSSNSCAFLCTGLCIKGAKPNKKTLHLFVILLFVYFTCSDFSFGFHTLTPTYPPIPDTTAITANVKRYENTILKNSIKFAINTTSHSAGKNLQKSFQQFIKINYFAIHIIPLGLLHRQAELLLFLFKLITVVTVHTRAMHLLHGVGASAKMRAF